MSEAQRHAAAYMEAMNDALLEWLIVGKPTIGTRLKVGRSVRKLGEALTREVDNG